MPKFALLIASAVCAVSLAACSSAEDQAQEATQQNNAQLCASLDDLQSQLDAADTGGAEDQTVSGTASVEDIRESLQQLGEAFDQINANSDALSASVKEQITLAQEQYQNELNGIDENTPLPDALRQAKAARENLNKQYQQIFTEVGCN